MNGWWKDTGKIEDMLEANRIVLETFEHDVRGTDRSASSHIEGKVVVEEGVEIVDSLVRGPVVIGTRRAHRARLRRPLHLDRQPLHARVLRDRELDRAGRLGHRDTSTAASRLA